MGTDPRNMASRVLARGFLPMGISTSRLVWWRDPGMYGLLMAAAAIFSFGKWFAFAPLLGPAAFGYYALLDLIAGYGSYVGTLGLLDAANRNVPLLVGARLRHRAIALGAQVGGTILLMSAGAAVVFAAGVVLFVSDQALKWTLLAATLFSFANNFFLFGMLLMVAHGRSVQYASLMLVKNAGALVLGTALGLRFGLWGVISAEIGIIAALSVYLALPKLHLPRLRIGSPPLLHGLFAIGLPLMGSNLAQNLGRNLDRLVVVTALGVGVFGQYSYAMMPALAGLVALNIVSQYITPLVCREIGAGREITQIRRQLDRAIIPILVFAAFAYPVFFFAVDFGARILPDFASGWSLMKITYWGAVLQIVQLYQTVLFACGAGWLLLRQSALVTAVATALCVGAMLGGLGAEAFAVIFVFHRLLAAVLVWLAVTDKNLRHRDYRPLDSAPRLPN